MRNKMRWRVNTFNEMTPFFVFICNKERERVHEIFLKPKLKSKIMQFTHQLKTSFSILEFTKYFLTSSALQTLVPPDSYLLLRLSRILNISSVSFSSSLNRLNTLRPDQKFVPIGNAQNLSSGFIQQSCVMEINTAQHH